MYYRTRPPIEMANPTLRSRGQTDRHRNTITELVESFTSIRELMFSNGTGASISTPLLAPVLCLSSPTYLLVGLFRTKAPQEYCALPAYETLNNSCIYGYFMCFRVVLSLILCVLWGTCSQSLLSIKTPCLKIFTHAHTHNFSRRLYGPTATSNHLPDTVNCLRTVSWNHWIHIYRIEFNKNSIWWKLADANWGTATVDID